MGFIRLEEASSLSVWLNIVLLLQTQMQFVAANETILRISLNATNNCENFQYQ